MDDKKADIDGCAPRTCDVMASRWQLAPVDLSMPDSGLNMPDVKLEALCDIIFADLGLKTWILK